MRRKLAGLVEAIRALIDRVEVHPPQQGAREPRIELQGHLASMLRAAGLDAHQNMKSPLVLASGLEVCLGSELVGAGTRNRRCHYISLAI